MKRIRFPLALLGLLVLGCGGANQLRIDSGLDATIRELYEISLKPGESYDFDLRYDVDDVYGEITLVAPLTTTPGPGVQSTAPANTSDSFTVRCTADAGAVPQSSHLTLEADPPAGHTAGDSQQNSVSVSVPINIYDPQLSYEVATDVASLSIPLGTSKPANVTITPGPNFAGRVHITGLADEHEVTVTTPDVTLAPGTPTTIGLNIKRTKEQGVDFNFRDWVPLVVGVDGTLNGKKVRVTKMIRLYAVDHVEGHVTGPTGTTVSAGSTLDFTVVVGPAPQLNGPVDFQPKLIIGVDDSQPGERPEFTVRYDQPSLTIRSGETLSTGIHVDVPAGMAGHHLTFKVDSQQDNVRLSPSYKYDAVASSSDHTLNGTYKGTWTSGSNTGPMDLYLGFYTNEDETNVVVGSITVGELLYSFDSGSYNRRTGAISIVLYRSGVQGSLTGTLQATPAGDASGTVQVNLTNLHQSFSAQVTLAKQPN